MKTIKLLDSNPVSETMGISIYRFEINGYLMERLSWEEVLKKVTFEGYKYISYF